MVCDKGITSSLACKYLVVQPCFEGRKGVWVGVVIHQYTLSPVHFGSPLASQNITGRVNYNERNAIAALKSSSLQAVMCAHSVDEITNGIVI